MCVKRHPTHSHENDFLIVLHDAQWVIHNMNQRTSHPNCHVTNSFKVKISLHVAKDSKVMILFFTSQQIKHLPKEMCQKSNIDTTFDFVKYPKYSRNNPFLKTIPKNNLE